MSELQQTKKNSFAANIAFSVLGWGGPLVFAFVATPFLIHGLGVEQYGYYSLVLAIIGFGFTTGIGKISAKYTPELRAAGEKDELARILFASLILTVAAAVLEGIILALAAPFVVENILNVPNEAQNELTTAVHLACLIGPAMMISQIFQSAAQGLHLFRTSSIIAVLIALALNAGSIFFAVNGFSYSHIFIWNLGLVLVGIAAYFVFVKQYLPELKLRPGAGGSVYKKVGRYAASIFVYQTITSVLFIFERAFVLRNFGSEALTYYTVPLMLGIYLHALIVSFSQAAVPKLNENLNEPDQLARFYELSTKIVLSLTVLIALGYFALGGQFLTLWLGSEFGERSYSLLIIHGSAFALIAVSINCWILAEASHRSGLNALSSSITSVIGVALIILLSTSVGINGVASGRLIGAAAVLPLIPYLEVKVFGTPKLMFWLVSVVKVVAASAIAFLVTRLIVDYFSPSWLMFILGGLLLTLVYAGSLFALHLFSSDELK